MIFRRDEKCTHRDYSSWRVLGNLENEGLGMDPSNLCFCVNWNCILLTFSGQEHAHLYHVGQVFIFPIRSAFPLVLLANSQPSLGTQLHVPRVSVSCLAFLLLSKQRSHISTVAWVSPWEGCLLWNLYFPCLMLTGKSSPCLARCLYSSKWPLRQSCDTDSDT